jgi:hypothetical protein
MSNFKPITTRAKCDYSNLPVNQEVTVDAKGKTPVKLGYKSPLKEIDRMGQRILNQVDKSEKAKSEDKDRKALKHENRARRMNLRDLNRKSDNNKSPLKKPLVGDQHRLPDHLKAKILASPAKQTKPINRRQNQPSNQNDGTIRVKDAVGAAGDIAKNLVGKVGDIKLSTPEGRKRRQERKDLRKKQKIERKQARVDQLKNSPAQKKCYK